MGCMMQGGALLMEKFKVQPEALETSHRDAIEGKPKALETPENLERKHCH